MTVNRTTLLDLPLPVTGTESGTWGDTTNNGLTQYLDIAIAGTLVLSTDADVTLTSTEGDSSATNIGATTAQYAILRWTATGSTTRNITALAQSKTYVVINATGGTQSIVLRGAGPTTGVTIISGEKAFCVWNGSDFVKVSSSAAAGGSNTQVQYNSSGVLAGSSNLTFDGTSLTLGGNPTLSAGTANGVLYLNGSKVATSGSALTYNGTNIGLGYTADARGGVVLTTTNNSGVNEQGGFQVTNGNSTGLFAGVNGAAFTTGGIGNANNAVLYSIGNTDLVFGRNTSEQMRLTSTGLGIGTSSPATKLHLYTPAAATTLTIDSGTSGTAIAYSLAGVAKYTAEYVSASNFYSIGRSGVAYDFVLSGGNVGIGTSSPAQKLALFASSANVGMRMSSSGGTGRDFDLISNTAGNLVVKSDLQSNILTYDGILGNLGLGVTPSAWTNYTAAQIGPVGSFASANYGAGNKQTVLLNNAYHNSGFKYLSSDFAGMFRVINNQFEWHTAPSGTAGNAISFTQAMTLDASGNLLVGTTTSPSQQAVIYRTSANTSNGALLLDGNGNYAGLQFATSGTLQGSLAVDNTALYLTHGSTLTFRTGASTNVGGTERARITSGGDLLVGTTSATNSPTTGVQLVNGGAGGGVFIGHPNGVASGNYYATFAYNSGIVGSITQDGTTAVLFNTTSDQRLKENICDAEDAATLIDSIKVRQYDWKSDGSHQRYGFVAQELLTVAPEAVHQPADPDEMMAVDYSKLVPMLVKEIQSLRQRVALLEGN